MRVGFAGLGNMGVPIARNLLRAGHDLTVYNGTRSKAEALASAGAKVANSLAEASAPEVVITMLADDPAVEQTNFGDGGILNTLARGDEQRRSCRLSRLCCGGGRCSFRGEWLSGEF